VPYILQKELSLFFQVTGQPAKRGITIALSTCYQSYNVPLNFLFYFFHSGIAKLTVVLGNFLLIVFSLPQINAMMCDNNYKNFKEA